MNTSEERTRLLEDPAAPGDRLARAWRRFRRLPGGRRLFSRLVGRTAPYSGSIGAQVLELAPGYALLALRDRRRLRNHVGSVHALALANLGELASGLAMTLALPRGVRGIPVRIEVDYVKKARGRLLCTGSAEPPPDIASEVESLALGEITDASGDLVATVLVRWRLGPVG
jgi:acyl-coenzyme A thioesterase PaaI-like protein